MEQNKEESRTRTKKLKGENQSAVGSRGAVANQGGQGRNWGPKLLCRTKQSHCQWPHGEGQRFAICWTARGNVNAVAGRTLTARRPIAFEVIPSKVKRSPQKGFPGKKYQRKPTLQKLTVEEHSLACGKSNNDIKNVRLHQRQQLSKKNNKVLYICPYATVKLKGAEVICAHRRQYYDTFDT
ncbi:hypothetical protein M514_26665 [Trichuris suis]|uniref:Uncharacterized protein n=1 Tax=Trichuris suis TaxID=68888 RepID=A0A085MVD2_9BILA|nr:hypothetical protein M514_26665 [Trichuris suis]